MEESPLMIHHFQRFLHRVKASIEASVIPSEDEARHYSDMITAALASGATGEVLWADLVHLADGCMLASDQKAQSASTAEKVNTRSVYWKSKVDSARTCDKSLPTHLLDPSPVQGENNEERAT